MTRDNGTKTTMMWHLWENAVVMEALHRGASLDGIKATRQRLVTWFNAGEPVWMAADSLYHFAQGYVIRTRVEADRNFRKTLLRNRKEIVCPN